MIRAALQEPEQRAALPANINVAGARLPASYEQAKAALANCTSLDECKDWADKAAALASYARQADDDTLQKHAMRIQARAVRRCGELLKTFNNERARTDLADTIVTQTRAARDAGISERQQITAVRVANIPAPEFEAAVEGPKKPTISQLALMGRKVRPVPPPGFQQATHLLGTVRRFAEFCAENDPAFLAGGVLPQEAKEVRQQVAAIDSWLDRFVVTLKG